MLKYSEVGVESRNLMFEQFCALQSHPHGSDARTCRLHFLQMLLQAVDCAVSRVNPLWLDYAADDRHALPCLLNVDLIRMEVHIEFLLQSDADHSNRSGDVFLSVADDGHVIDKTHVFALEASHDSQDNTVKDGEEEGTEQLRGDVADGHASIRRGVEPALVRIEKLPQVKPSTPFAVFLGDMHQGHFGKP